MSSWLHSLQEAASGAETPKSFMYWSGLTAIAAVVANNIWLNRRDADTKKVVYQLKPNLYVMLVADSGLGKGLPVAVAKECVTQIQNTRVISGRNSIEGIIAKMAMTQSAQNGQPPLPDARAFIVSGEFANLMLSNPQALTILTEWYDTHFMGEWSNTLKNSPIEKLKGVNVTLLGASSPEHFAEAVPEINIRGGFIGRTLMVYEEKRNRTNPLVFLDEPKDEIADQIVTPDIIAHLKEISQLKGRFNWTQPAADVFMPWYMEWRDKEWDDKTGTVHRMPDHVLKVAMCLALSRRTDLQIHYEDIEEAIHKCLSLTINTRRITAKGKHPLSEKMKQVLDYLYKSEEHTRTRQQILIKCYGDVFAEDLDIIEQNLTERGAMKVRKEPGKTHYTLTAGAVAFYESVMGELRKG